MKRYYKTYFRERTGTPIKIKVSIVTKGNCKLKETLEAVSCMQQTHKHKMKVNMICSLIEGSTMHVSACVLK